MRQTEKRRGGEVGCNSIIRWVEKERLRGEQREIGCPVNMLTYLHAHTLTQTYTHSMMTAFLILNITCKHIPVSLSEKSPYLSEPPVAASLRPTCRDARWHTRLWDLVVLYLMMNYASAAVTLKNAITSVIRQMGLFCLAYAVHLLRVLETELRAHKRACGRIHVCIHEHGRARNHARGCLRFNQCVLSVEATQIHDIQLIGKTNKAHGSKWIVPNWR